MIVDSSAIVAIALRETEYELLIDKIAAVTQAGIGAPALVETVIVLSARLRRDARGTAARMLQEFGIGVIPFADTHYGIAVDAWLRFEEGHHPAALNLGNCLTYALAKVTMRPLYWGISRRQI